MERYSASEQETEAIGREMAQQLAPGAVVAFTGDLGAGKTAFVRGMAQGLGISQRVTSPTFTIVNEYEGGTLPLFHFDMYRLRDADAIYLEEIAAAGLGASINQYFSVLTNTRSVGVMGDGRTYDYTLALRAVTTSDFMTADWARIPYDVLDRISTRIVNEVQGINRIVYDITSKPPATIEWE